MGLSILQQPVYKKSTSDFASPGRTSGSHFQGSKLPNLPRNYENYLWVILQISRNNYRYGNKSANKIKSN